MSDNHALETIGLRASVACRSRLQNLLAFVLLIPFLPSSASALDLAESLSIHGFGGWAYAVTDENLYLIGDEDGVWDNVQMSLNFTASISSQATIVAQIALFQNRGKIGTSQEDDIETDLDYAFAEWKFSDAARLRLGRVKHPFGIYAEIFDVGTLRPFFMLPQSIYGPQGITAKSIDGVGFLGNVDSSGWSTEYNLYAGKIQGTLQVPGPFAADPSQQLLPEVVSDFVVDDVFGGKVDVSTPWDGLRFGVSAYFGEQTLAEVTQTESAQSYDVLGAHVEYEGERWLVRVEGSTFDLDDQFTADGAYGEVAYRFTPHWQAAVRYDWWEGDSAALDLTQVPPFITQFLENQDLGIALNYWFNPRFVLKFNFHQIEGNRFAAPNTVAEMLQVFITGQLEEDTEMFVIGAQFSF